MTGRMGRRRAMLADAPSQRRRRRGTPETCRSVAVPHLPASPRRSGPPTSERVPYFVRPSNHVGRRKDAEFLTQAQRTEKMHHVASLFWSQLRVPPWGRSPGLHRSVCLPQAGRSQHIDPHSGRAPIRRRDPARTDDRRALRARGALRDQDRHGRRCHRRYRLPGALRVSWGRGADGDAAPPGGRAGRRDGRGRAGSRRGSAGLDGTGATGGTGRRLSLLRGLAQRSLLLRRGCLQQLSVRGHGLLRR